MRFIVYSHFKLSHFKYLGVMVQLQLHNYNVNNLCLLIDLWQSKTNQWMSMPIDLLGRVNLKYFPPIFLYILSSSPCRIQKAYIHGTNSICNSFLWQQKSARISLRKLPFSHHGLRILTFIYIIWQLS